MPNTARTAPLTTGVCQDGLPGSPGFRPLGGESFVQAVFSDALARPGDVSQPLVFGDNVHILYYLADVEAGAVALTDDLREALRAALYGEQVDARLEERLDSLLAGADIVFAESE